MIILNPGAAHHPLSQETIANVTRAFAQDPYTVNRLVWWIRHGFACERWFQFEWSYRLSEYLSNTYEVGCEHKRMDIAIFKKQGIDWEKPSAGVEIKWFGNWWVDTTFKTLQADIEKVSKHDFPALALAVWFFVKPKTMVTSYKWIESQIEKKGLLRIVDLQSKVVKNLGRKPSVELTVSCNAHTDFNKLDLHVMGFPNDKLLDSTRLGRIII